MCSTWARTCVTGRCIRQFVSFCDAGKLGKLLTIEANEYYFGGRSYFRRWNRLREFGGGLWITKACHDFDLINWFAGGKPRRVFAMSNLSYYKPMDGAGPSLQGV